MPLPTTILTDQGHINLTSTDKYMCLFDKKLDMDRFTFDPPPPWCFSSKCILIFYHLSCFIILLQNFWHKTNFLLYPFFLSRINACVCLFAMSNFWKKTLDANKIPFGFVGVILIKMVCVLETSSLLTSSSSRPSWY